MKTKLLMITGALIILISCSKEKKALKNISGEWVITSWQLDSADVSENFLEFFSAFGTETIQMNFNECDAGSSCNVTTSQFDANNSLTQTDETTYSISEDGGMITIDTTTMTIQSLSSSDMEIFNPVTELNSNYSETLTLQKL
jgi:hypothetical protein